MEVRRTHLEPQAAEGLKTRYAAHRDTERELVAFLAGVIAGLGIDPASVEGYDDATSELIFKETVT